MSHLTKIAAVAAAGAVLVPALASAQGPQPYKKPANAPVGAITTYYDATGASKDLKCIFKDDVDPHSTDLCDRAGMDGDDAILGPWNAFKAVRAEHRLINKDGSISGVITDEVVIPKYNRIISQAVGFDNATVSCRIDGGCASVRHRSTKQQIIKELRASGLLTARLKASLNGDDPFLVD